MSLPDHSTPATAAIAGRPIPPLSRPTAVGLSLTILASFAWLLAQLVEDAAHQRKLAIELGAALKDVSQLRDLIPIGAWCKRVREDTGYLKQVDEYLQERDLATFTHGICPECERKTFGD